MRRTIRNINQYVCKRCKREYWSTDMKAGWCDECRRANRMARAARKSKGRERAGQLNLGLE